MGERVEQRFNGQAQANEQEAIEELTDWKGFVAQEANGQKKGPRDGELGQFGEPVADGGADEGGGDENDGRKQEGETDAFAGLEWFQRGAEAAGDHLGMNFEACLGAEGGFMAVA